MLAGSRLSHGRSESTRKNTVVSLKRVLLSGEGSESDGSSSEARRLVAIVELMMMNVDKNEDDGAGFDSCGLR